MAVGKIFETIGCKATADLYNFPLDKHDVTIFISVGLTTAGQASRVQYEPAHAEVALSFFPKDQLVQDDEWPASKVIYGLGQHGSGMTGILYHDLVIQVQRRRASGYFTRKALYPTLLCALLSLAALIIPADELAGRFSVLLTLLLTVYAIQWVSVSSHINYITFRLCSQARADFVLWVLDRPAAKDTDNDAAGLAMGSKGSLSSHFH
jgi:hypothetical protein